MSRIETNCPNYFNFQIIKKGTFGNLYKAKNIENGYYYAIKEIEKNQYSEDQILKEIEIMNNIKCENSVSIKDKIETKDFYYIIMDLCGYNLEEYIKMREKPISIEEIKHILLQLNNVFKIMYNKKIIHGDLKLSNILISHERLDKSIIKLSDFLSSKKNSNSRSVVDISLTISPEILNDKEDISKCDLWSLGIIIYYMYFQNYPYNGKNEFILLNDINSGKKLNQIDNEELNDLMNKLLKINVNERLSWEEYFNHKFFKKEDNNKNIPFFNFKCQKHSKNLNFYCYNCKLNICEYCLKEHNNHKIIPFYNIGLNEEEIKRFEILFIEIEKKINSFNQLKNDIQSFFNKMKLIKENISIYKSDEENNFKKYYINILETINSQLENKLNIINLKENNSWGFKIKQYINFS